MELLAITEPKSRQIYFRGLQAPIQIYVYTKDLTSLNDAKRRSIRKESQDARLGVLTQSNTEIVERVVKLLCTQKNDVQVRYGGNDKPRDNHRSSRQE